LLQTPQDTTELDALKAENEKLKVEIEQIEKRWERFADEIARNNSLHDYSTKLHNENYGLKDKLNWETHKVTKLTAENEKLKGEVKRLLSDLDTKFTKNKPLKENIEMHRKLDKLNEIQKECFMATKQARKLLSQFEDMTDNGLCFNFSELVDKLVSKIKLKIYKAYELNEAENDLLNVELDWDKIFFDDDESSNLHA
jgi:cell division protein FtsB